MLLTSFSCINYTTLGGLRQGRVRVEMETWGDVLNVSGLDQRGGPSEAASGFWGVHLPDEIIHGLAAGKAAFGRVPILDAHLFPQPPAEEDQRSGTLAIEIHQAVLQILDHGPARAQLVEHRLAFSH